MKVVILVLALCGIAAATHPFQKLMKRQDCSDINTDELLNVPASCATLDPINDAQRACEECVAPVCRAYQGPDADACRQPICDSCNLLGVEVSDCCTGGGTTQPTDGPTEPTICTSIPDLSKISDDCVARFLDFGDNTTMEEAVDGCRDCAAEVCNAYDGFSDEAACRRDVYVTCDFYDVKISECGALALVTVKGVLAVVLLIAALLVF